MSQKRGIQKEERAWLIFIVAVLMLPIVLFLVFAAAFLFVKRTNEILRENINSLEKLVR